MHSPHSSPTEKIAPNRVVLVGTFRASQLENWPGFYNYPVNEETESIDFATVTDLWLFNDKKPAQFFHAEFLGFKTRADLIAEYGYKPKGKAHAAQYALFKTTISYTPPSYPDNTIEKVFLRLADFAASPRSKKRLKDASNTQTAAKLPEIVAKIPREKLLVCEPPLALQSDFADLETAPAFRLPVPYPAPRIGSFTFIDLFAGIGGIRLAYQELGGKCVFSSEWDPEAAKTYYANFGDRPFGDIRRIDPSEIPDFDVLLAGFPCQPFSIIGDQEGFEHETQGTLFFNVENILRVKKPKAFMLENVRNLTAHDHGRTFKIILSHLRDAGYDVHYKVLNALDYGVPQKRERIIICGFSKPTAFEFPPPIPFEDRKTVADIIDPDADADISLRVRPAIRESRLARLKDPNFPRPYISHENVSGSITPHNYSCALRAGASANYILINDERRPSPREMLRIQGFPDDFKIVVNYGQIKHQTGNSVAVPVMRAVAARVVEKLPEL